MGGVGILKFVDQEMIDAAVQLVLYPLGLVAVAQQAVGVPFQVGEIQQPAFLFDFLVVGEQAMPTGIPGPVDL